MYLMTCPLKMFQVVEKLCQQIKKKCYYVYNFFEFFCCWSLLGILNKWSTISIKIKILINIKVLLSYSFTDTLDMRKYYGNINRIFILKLTWLILTVFDQNFYQKYHETTCSQPMPGRLSDQKCFLIRFVWDIIKKIN